MIVNSTMNQETNGIPQCENFYLKRKLEENHLDDNQYVQPKKRHIQYYAINNNNFENLPSEIHEIPQNDNQCQLEQYNLNANCNFINECQTIEFLSYENTLEPIQTDLFDPTQWQNSDLLELDHKYNATHLAMTYDKRMDETLEETAQQNQLNHNNEPNHVLQQDTQNNESDIDLSWLMNFSFKLDELTGPPDPQYPQKKAVPIAEPKFSKPQQSKTGRKVDELIKEVTSEMLNDEVDISQVEITEPTTSRTPKKPPFTYTELIEYALEDKGELTVSGIYQWISDRFPFYKSNDDRWKNSVRHNLSINPHFRKGVKAPQGAGHLWTISSRDSEENALAWEHKKQRLELFFKMEEIHNLKYKQQAENNQTNYDEAEIAAANISQQMLNESSAIAQETNMCHQNLENNDEENDNQISNATINEDDLKRTAGEILNGVRRTVEVQQITNTISTYHDELLENEDYLNPITKEQSLHESGLREFYITEIDPIELGVNMSNVEEEVLFSDELNLNYFGITSGADIVA